MVGDIAQHLYDPDGLGPVIDLKTEGLDAALERSQRLAQSATTPVFEMGFRADGAMAFADVMLPVLSEEGARLWRMVEVKSSTSVKDYHRDDVAIQAYAARHSGLALQAISLAHIDTSWVYPGGSDYRGLLKEVDLTLEAFAREDEVAQWVDEAQATVASTSEPLRDIGPHCVAPFECGFFGHCSKDLPQFEQPIAWLPRLAANLRESLESQGIHELKDVPDDLLNEVQRRVKAHSVAKSVFFDQEGAAEDLKHHPLPAYFLDFETIQFTVPIWAGTRPFQQVPFQFSLHILDKQLNLKSTAFLGTSGNDPSLPFAQALIEACGQTGPVFVYNAGFETARIKELASRFTELSAALLSINERVVDLLPIARNRYYHHTQQGSWSIKKVLPAIDTSLDYSSLVGVQDGGMAQEAFLKAIDASTSKDQKAEIEKQLLAYCGLDTLAMVRLWSFFSGVHVNLKEPE